MGKRHRPYRKLGCYIEKNGTGVRWVGNRIERVPVVKRVSVTLELQDSSFDYLQYLANRKRMSLTAYLNAWLQTYLVKDAAYQSSKSKTRKQIECA